MKKVLAFTLADSEAFFCTFGMAKYGDHIVSLRAEQQLLTHLSWEAIFVRLATETLRVNWLTGCSTPYNVELPDRKTVKFARTDGVWAVDVVSVGKQDRIFLQTLSTHRKVSIACASIKDLVLMFGKMVCLTAETLSVYDLNAEDISGSVKSVNVSCSISEYLTVCKSRIGVAGERFLVTFSWGLEQRSTVSYDHGTCAAISDDHVVVGTSKGQLLFFSDSESPLGPVSVRTNSYDTEVNLVRFAGDMVVCAVRNDLTLWAIPKTSGGATPILSEFGAHSHDIRGLEVLHQSGGNCVVLSVADDLKIRGTTGSLGARHKIVVGCAQNLDGQVQVAICEYGVLVRGQTFATFHSFVGENPGPLPSVGVVDTVTSVAQGAWSLVQRVAPGWKLP